MNHLHNFVCDVRGTRAAPLAALASLCFALLAAPGVTPAGRVAQAESLTYRGNAQRTGAFDNRPMLAKPKVLWVYKAPEHFIAAPVPDGAGGGTLFVSGLGPFNSAQFHALSLDVRAKERVKWSKASPYIKMPSVSSPAIAGDLLIFGDGMHQTDGATLYCLSASKGLPLWQYHVPGKLVHMECPPTIAGNRVYMGAGDAGVLCLDTTRVTLDGKEQNLADVRPGIEAKYNGLMARYEAAKKKDPDFAVPPDENTLPKPKPKLHWQQGQKSWHVDAPLAVSADGKFVLAPSAFIDDDKVGKRALLCLNAADGSTAWEVPLTHNPWAGATISGDTVLVGCSSIRYDVQKLSEAKGQVLAFDLQTGREKWRRDTPGGVLAPVVAAGELALYAGTDGKLIARNINDGGRKWTFEARNAFFAAPAVAGELTYAVDLKGVVYAVNISDGTLAWQLDVTRDAMVQAPGTVFASPAIHGGHIYIVTNNLGGENADTPGVVICIGDASEAKPIRTGPAFVTDARARTVRIPCEIAPRKLPTLKDIYPLEVVATYPTPMGQKAHETVVTFDTQLRLSDVHKALEGLGARAGGVARPDGTPASGTPLKISLLLPGAAGRPRVVPIERTIVDIRTNKPLPPLTWYFTGSVMRQTDPDKPEEKAYGADLSGTLIAIYPVTGETLVQSSLTLQDASVLRLEMNKNVLPDEGTPAELLIEVAGPSAMPTESRPGGRR